MTNEAYLEYLTLREFMNCNISIDWENLNSEQDKGWYSDNTPFKFDLHKVKERLTELEKIIIKPYVIDNTL